MKPAWETDDRQPPHGSEDPADAELLAALRGALRPAPLSPELTQRIRSEFPPLRANQRRMTWSWLPPALAAAALAILFVAPPRDRSGTTTHDLAFSADEAQLVLAAFAGGRWYGLSDAAIDRMLADVDELATELTQQKTREEGEDWDLPAAPDRSDSPGTSRIRNESHAVL